MEPMQANGDPGVPDGISRPTVRQVQLDMGLQSDSVVFDAIRKLEDFCFIRNGSDP
jgi:hypothetical protein